MANTAGIIRALSIGGTSFNVMADAEIESVGSKFENSSIATSGPNIRKMVKRPQTREGVIIGATPEEQEILKAIADNTDTVALSYTTVSGTSYKCDGWIEFETHNTMENRATVKLMEENEWEVFI
jgi:hypothetical protein